VVLYGADIAWMVWPVLDWSLEDYALIIALALALRLDAVAAGRTLLSTLDAAFSARQTASFGPLPHLGVC
jgi:hypothetical protein